MGVYEAADAQSAIVHRRDVLLEATALSLLGLETVAASNRQGSSAALRAVARELMGVPGGLSVSEKTALPSAEDRLQRGLG